MADDANTSPLDYRGIPPKQIKVPEDAEFLRWRLLRVLFRIGVFVALTPITFYFGPNLINFGKLTSLSPEDFVSEVQSTCVPTVRAMKEYQRDTGNLPDKDEDLVPKYLASIPNGEHIFDGHFMKFTRRAAMHFIEYDFTPGSEGWRVEGPFAQGPIPVPAVTVAPAKPPAVPPL